jgi:hypothetical protein
MSVIIRFSLDSINYQISDVGSCWTIRCSAHYTEPQNPFSSTGSSTDSAELNIYRRQEGMLNGMMMVQNLDEQIAQWRENGYPCDADVLVLRHIPKGEHWDQILGVSVALNEPKFNTVQAFLLQHIGRSDLAASVICPFHGFSEPKDEKLAFPTYEQFYHDGRPFFITGDLSVAFGCKSQT